MNLFFVQSDGSIVTPELSGSILEGITRDSIITLARDLGHDVVERQVSIDEWRDGCADGTITEVFACGTAAVVTPIRSLKWADGEAVTSDGEAGKVTMDLRSALIDIQYGRAEDRHGWMQRVARRMTVATRTEHDLIGEREVPLDAYWGIHTLRALENFPITGIPIGESPYLVEAIAAVKEAAATTNHELGLLDDERFGAIRTACEEIRAGALHDEFVVDVMQGGAGTSTNMNANEVIANRALELLGHQKGEYHLVHPNEHVNLSQSTNDVYPTSIKVAIILATHSLLAAMEVLQDSFMRKAEEFHDVLKMGRTQLQDAVPMTLGQEFGTYGVMIGEDRAPPLRGRHDAARDQPRRHGHRHPAQRPGRLRADRLRAPRVAHRAPARERRRPRSRPPRTAAPSSSCPACSSASRSSSPRSATTCGCSRPGRAPA